MPTGTGKTLVIGGFIKEVLQRFSNQKILVLTHVKELVEQNYEKLLQLWPSAPVGINNAELGVRDYNSPCIMGSIQSVAKNAGDFGAIDLIIIDEAHLVSDKEGTQYNKFIKDCQSINPNIKVIGLSATVYRQGLGMLVDGDIFDEVVYDLTKPEHFARLIAEGYLAPLFVKRPDNSIDVEGVRITAGEYNLKQLQETVNVSEKVFAAVGEFINVGANYRSWLAFAAGTEHSDNIARILNECGVPAASLHTRVGKKMRKEIIEAHKNNELRALVNNNILTTGYDNPQIDLLGIFRPTRSTSLWVQMLGRGTRPSPDTGKTHCFVMDFAKNASLLGPIDNPVLPKKKGQKAGEAPIKICGECGMNNNISAVECAFCGVQFTRQEKIADKAGQATVMQAAENEEVEIKIIDVDQVFYFKHNKKHPPSMRVSYRCGMTTFDEYVALENPRGRGLAKRWWQARTMLDLPLTVDEALTFTSALAKPKALRVWINKKPYPQIMSGVFE